MSNYVFSKNNTHDDCPELLIEYLTHLRIIKTRSERTVNGYYIDLKMFLRYLVLTRENRFDNIIENDVDIRLLEDDFFKAINRREIFSFIKFLADSRDNTVSKSVGVGVTARARKLSAIKGFLKFLTVDKGVLKENPAKDIDSPPPRKSLPKYLTLEDSKKLLSEEAVLDSREYCILMLFLNCGMRLSELCGINLTDIRENSIRVLGKGNKERIVYLNDACIKAIDEYIADRNKIENIKDDKALFIGPKTRKRLSSRRVQQIVEGCLHRAGLSGMGYSAHKLRHTAATLLYQYGKADMLALKEILGHEHVSTTEIYTHISQKKLMEAATSSPLGDITPPKLK